MRKTVRCGSMIAAFVISWLGAPASAETFALANSWNELVQLTAERNADYPTIDIASPAWQSADWVTEPAPDRYGPGAVYIRNAWRSDRYLTYQHEVYPDSIKASLVLMPRIDNPLDNRRTVLADGQAWRIEPIPGTDEVRIRTAWPGFGETYINIEPEDGLSLIPRVSPIGQGWLSARWKKFQSSHTAPTQCIRNLSATVITVNWYNMSDVRPLRMHEGQIPIWPPGDGVKPAFSETKSLGFSSCNTTSQRMFATVELFGKREVELGVSFLAGGVIVVGSFATGGASLAAGAGGMTALYAYLEAKPNTVYLGVPGQEVQITGTLFDAKATTIVSHDR